jgi:hypothetical protein
MSTRPLRSRADLRLRFAQAPIGLLELHAGCGHHRAPFGLLRHDEGGKFLGRAGRRRRALGREFRSQLLRLERPHGGITQLVGRNSEAYSATRPRRSLERVNRHPQNRWKLWPLTGLSAFALSAWSLKCGVLSEVARRMAEYALLFRPTNYEVLARKRPLTLNMIQCLHAGLGIPADMLGSVGEKERDHGRELLLLGDP